MKIKVYMNKKVKRQGKTIIERKLVVASLIEVRSKSIVVKLDNGDVIERNIKKDVPYAIRQLKY